MKRIFAPLFLLLLLLFPACSSIENPAEVPYDHSALVGMDYDEALSVLKGAGFVNIESTERSTKNIDHNNKISAISIDGNTTFSKGKVWENDVPVEISYFALEQLDVTIDIETGGEDGKPVFAVKTNLPDKVELTLALQDDDMYFEQQTVIVKNGVAESEPFTNGGVALYGHCTLTVVMEPAQQPDGVQRAVGDDGRLLTGELIEASPDGGSYVFYECSYDSPYKSESDIPPESLSLGDLYTAIGITLSSSFGENYSMSMDGNTITANVWVSGIAMEAMLAANGDAEKLSDWNAMVENIKSAVEQTQSILNDNGHGDVIYIMQVANDLSENHENVLLSVSMGMVFYDYVNGIDLL